MRRLPRTEFGSLRSQATSAAESVVFNLVEGCACSSQKELARFLEMSIRSSSELESQLELARDYGALQHRSWQALMKEVVDVRRTLCGLRAKVLTAEHEK